jgi:hypothetical protein
MLSLVDNRKGFSRRSFLRVGSLALGGLALPELFAARAAAGSKGAKLLHDKSVVFLFMHGGPSQYETFDPKMSAPSEIRSATGEVETAIPGVTFGGTFPRLAARAKRLTVVRSYRTGDGDHRIHPIVSRDSHDANLGSIYARVAGATRRESGMPNNVVLFPRAVDPSAGPNQEDYGKFGRTGPLGSAYAPVVPGSVDEGAGGSMQKDMQLVMARDRLDDRRSLLSSLDGIKRQLEVRGMDAYRQQAYDTIVGGVARAFDLSQEDPRTIERYDTSRLVNPESILRNQARLGFYRYYVDHGKALGKELLLARRLVEAGCGFVTVTTNFAWDMHGDGNNPGVDEGMHFSGTAFDHAVSVFLDDLRERGLEDRVLLVATGEMGRSPRINGGGGRDHWGGSTPLLLSGGGLTMGQVVGQSTRDGGEPAGDPQSISNLYATIMHTLLDVGQLRVTQGMPREVLSVATSAPPIPGLV